jgi:hypothetical protein
MIVNCLLKDLAFSNPARRMQRSSENRTGCRTGCRTASSDGSGNDFNIIGIYIVGVVVTVLAAIGCIRMVYVCLSTRRTLNATDAPELLDDKSVHKTPKTTIAKRKQAILELFETTQVTMVSNDNNLMGSHCQNKQFTQRRKLTIYISFRK